MSCRNFLSSSLFPVKGLGIFIFLTEVFSSVSFLSAIVVVVLIGKDFGVSLFRSTSAENNLSTGSDISGTVS